MGEVSCTISHSSLISVRAGVRAQLSLPSFYQVAAGQKDRMETRGRRKSGMSQGRPYRAP